MRKASLTFDPINPIVTNPTARSVNPGNGAQPVYGGCTLCARIVTPDLAIKHGR